MINLAEIVQNAIFDDADFLYRSRSVAAAADEPWYCIGHDSSHGGDVAIPQHVERIFLRSAEIRVLRRRASPRLYAFVR